MAITEKLRNMAEEVGIRLERVGGIPVWEAQPVYRHQTVIFRIQTSIRRTEGGSNQCGCVHVSDVCIRFPDGSQKRPDIAIFCREPDEQDEEITLLPEAVIEILSKGYEAKDLQIGVPFYLAQGIRDVIVFDPYTLKVLHFRQKETREMTSPVEIALECGCLCTV
ncbi:MAG TPA: Uma2 family endonuclease [Chthonomonadaceae bacterium]|nr:Uma2 family endonuclease [Chthonomonadaceae bacterium]